MQYNYKKLDKLSAKLERLFKPIHPRGVEWTEPLEQHDGLAPGERIVEDYFDDADGETVIKTERITDDASDEGYDFPHGTWDRKRLDALVRNPPPIHIVIWKKRRSSRIAPTCSPEKVQGPSRNRRAGSPRAVRPKLIDSTHLGTGENQATEL